MKYKNKIIFFYIEEQDLGPDFEDIDCVGDTPFQNQDPSEIFFDIGG